jgi:hypothetical protein
MGLKKPFHRNYRKMKAGPNSGYSDWAYIVDRQYAQDPEQFIRAFLIIQSDILKLFEFVEPSDINLATYSFRIHELLMRTCIELEANFKAILRENIYNPIYRKGPRAGSYRAENVWNIDDFKIINKTHHLSGYSVQLPFWKGHKKIRKPFENWRTEESLIWYQAYNHSKHDRHHKFNEANLENLLEAYCGLFVVLSSQFKTESFETGSHSLRINTDSYFSGRFGIGGYLMIEFPNEWTDDEIYDFDWSVLKNEDSRFEKINYNNL